MPALMLAVCAVAQGWGQRSELFNRWTDYHYYGFRYENKTLLTDPRGTTLPQAANAAIWPLPHLTLSMTSSGIWSTLPPTTAGPPTASTWRTWTETWPQSRCRAS